METYLASSEFGIREGKIKAVEINSRYRIYTKRLLSDRVWEGTSISNLKRPLWNLT